MQGGFGTVLKYLASIAATILHISSTQHAVHDGDGIVVGVAALIDCNDVGDSVSQGGSR